jgi:hypothetical protein
MQRLAYMLGAGAIICAVWATLVLAQTFKDPEHWALSLQLAVQKSEAVALERRVTISESRIDVMENRAFMLTIAAFGALAGSLASAVFGALTHRSVRARPGGEYG